MYDDSSVVKVKCLPVTQPIGTFYVGAMSASDLVDISWADIRRIAPNESELKGTYEETEEVPVIDPTLPV